MEYPNVEFKKLSLKDNVDIVKWAYTQDDSLNTRVQVEESFPGINENNIDTLVTNTYNEVSNNLFECITNYETYWNSISEYYFKELFSYLSLDEYKDKITVYVGILPIAPRDIYNKEIYINIGMSKNKFLNIMTHEILHFVWFNKFQKLYPDISINEFNAPYNPWIYSELVTPIILNRESIIKLTNSKEECLYDFMDEEVMSNLGEIFSKNTNIDDRITEGYEYIKNYFTNN